VNGTMEKQAGVYLARRRKHQQWLSVFLLLALAVTYGTFRELRIEGEALNHKQMELVCTARGLVAHEHNDDCYDEDGELRCPLPELELHEHDDSCYEEMNALICDRLESDGHVHDASCYERVRDEEPSCGIDNENHVHGDACYGWHEELTCTIPEGEGAHHHGLGCYEVQYALACGLPEVTEEHVHTDECFREIDMTAEEVEEYVQQRDAEPEIVPAVHEEWTAEELELTGNWREDLLAVALEQVGYAPEDGWNRYMDWYGQTEGAWDATFVSFCLSHANIPARAVPRVSDTAAWIDELTKLALVGEYDCDEPVPGDVLLLENEDETLRPAVFVEYGEDDDEQIILKVIEVRDDSVVFGEYADDDPALVACVRIPDAKEWEKSQQNSEYPARTFTGESGAVRVTVEADAGAFPAGTTMVLTAVPSDEIETAVTGAVDAKVTGVEAVDISFRDKDGNEIEPLIPIRVTMSAPKIAHADAAQVVHIGSDGEPTVVEQTAAAQLDAPVGDDEVVFDSDAFSVYALVYVIEKYVTDCQGDTWRITVSYTDDAQLPEGVEVEAEEIGPAFALYGAYTEKAADAVGCEADSARLRLFDIRLVKDGRKVKNAAPVDVTVELADHDTSLTTHVVHFADGSATGDVVSGVTAEGERVSFTAEGFSVYAIVDAPEPYVAAIQKVSDPDNELPGGPFYISYNGLNKYWSSNVLGSGALEETNSVGGAAEWYFETTGTDGQYYIYTMVGAEKRYIHQTGSGANTIELSAGSKTAFTVSMPENGKLLIKHATQNRWLQHSIGGGGIRLWTDANNATNSRMTFSYPESYVVNDDPYELDGRSWGVAYNDESVTAGAMMAQAAGSRLAQTSMLIRPDVLNNDGSLLVAENTDISMWTFHAQGMQTYTMSATADGAVKYLKMSGATVSLVDDPAEATALKATPGTGARSGKWQLSANGYVLNYTKDGFAGVTGNPGTSWLSFVRESSISQDDFTLYNARKVSVSDTTNVPDGAQVVIYTRVWNDTTKRYEFYVVDHNGTLARCYDTGDGIEWIGSQINTALWDFTEYHNSDGTPNYYYELTNTQYGNVLAPQNGSAVADDPVGVNLSGRRYGETKTTIVAWDDANYGYVGLKVEDGRVVPCPLAEAADFYFAIVRPVVPVGEAPELSTVNTIDNDEFGITMKMVDFGNVRAYGSHRRSADLHDFFYAPGGANGNGDNNAAGMMTNDLKADGYPESTDATHQAGVSLGELYTGTESGLFDVNHLFIESIHNESGYFEFDSTQNHAQLDTDTNTFTVYDQLMAIGTDSGPTRTHGQFLPYADIVAAHDEGRTAPFRNLTTVDQTTLSDSDPRKGEIMYWVPGEDQYYFFGMEMEASFTQTASGLDAWGHDIIFEFSGDDDFWFYVDGELVLDLGGVHKAMSGSINFRTGQVTSSRGNSTLYEIFRSNYQSRGMTEDQISAKLDEIFHLNSEGNYVFRDYTNHDMKMFYMERGAGASNLHMRFNLAAVKPGTFQLSKSISGATVTDSSLLRFPYQIYYTLKTDPIGGPPHLLSDPAAVTYKDSTREVPYQAHYTPADGTQDYDSVFFLRPGETAQVAMPLDVAEYWVVECAVNPDIYEQVTVNDETIAGTATVNEVGGTARRDYAAPHDTLEARKKVEYDNCVDEDAMSALRIKKVLYDSDGTALLTADQDGTEFSFRLYLGSEDENAADLPLAYLYSYYVIDPAGNYCRWDAAQGGFVSLGVSTFEALQTYFTANNWTAAQKESVIFKTSMNGAISRIPAGYSVEIRDLVLGTQYKVEERENEIPRGYTLRLEDGYTRTDAGHEQNNGTEPYADYIHKDEDPQIDIRNQKGWGLTVHKDWTDSDFVGDHDPVWFAVYVRSGSTETLVPGTVRRLAPGGTELYYFFGNLQSGIPFSDYVVHEVTLSDTNVAYDEEGYVTSDLTGVTITPIEEGGTVTAQAELLNNPESYTVRYHVGEQTTENQNVRTDTVVNSRPGVELYKTDWNGAHPLAGAVFKLTDTDGEPISAAASYTTDASGRITTAYLSAGTYYLDEIGTPKGYVGAQRVTITVAADGTVTAAGPDGASDFFQLETYEEDSDMIARLTVWNRSGAFSAKKIDSVSLDPLEDVTFALYRQVEDVNHNLVRDYEPIPGYEELLTDVNGVVDRITGELPAGTYYLSEKETLPGYQLLDEDICFTISITGSVSIKSAPAGVELVTENGGGVMSYTLLIKNGVMQEVWLRKTVIGTDRVLPGASFALYNKDDCDENDRPLAGKDPVITGVTDGSGLLRLGLLPQGEYRLIETEAPAGYHPYPGAMHLTVTATSVAATQGSALSNVTHAADTWQVEFWNTEGVELPMTGGSGWVLQSALGAMMAFGAGGTIALRRKKR